MNESNLLRIRECHYADLDSVAQIEDACYGVTNALSRMSLTQYLDLLGSTFVVSELSNTVVGFAVGGVAYSVDLELGWLLDVAVLPGFQGHRIGPKLCEHVLVALSKFGVQRIHATVAPENERSLRMLRSLEFYIIDDVTDYFGRGQRRLLMERCEKG
jgi:ribosomal-protein-alanine N-acetyltransferase